MVDAFECKNNWNLSARAPIRNVQNIFSGQILKFNSIIILGIIMLIFLLYSYKNRCVKLNNN
jgi:hypothetical protein